MNVSAYPEQPARIFSGQATVYSAVMGFIFTTSDTGGEAVVDGAVALSEKQDGRPGEDVYVYVYDLDLLAWNLA